ncbi:C-3 sterol dehydrogenase/C-4 decarboxylase [Trematosphaeria pertusa]|uniref:C-3 sterol dehydrogenase/C-4 decarboxylase n=1 Tax=Trematosphaeria pertusa TaxID=390896 RepID=A0A6A6J023_9PLEO|nr:C-3 sterol dehydrogenase/C-4 decarboxylase [Trematosphaeria pertusa]KAF2255190.1 C-3 sterol dehydrogenase/C-4 decarboxylase [Trematosphaeria pertusa]
MRLGTVLVVGGSGFLGSHIVKRLLSANHASHIAVTSRNPKTRDGKDDRLSYHAVDISSMSEIEALFQEIKPQVVIHTASPLPRSCPSVLHATNVIGTQNLLKAANACPETKAFVYTSSDSTCHPSPFKQITENQCILHTPATATNAYGKTKAIADAAVLVANSPELRTATLRLPAVYGEGDPNFIPQIIASIRNGEHKNQIGPNEKMFEFVYIESAAEAHILAARALLAKTPNASGQAYFITDGEPQPFFDFMRKCYAAAGYPVAKEEVRVIPFWVVMTIASVGEWAYWVFTLGLRTPKLRREDIEHLNTGCWWSEEKAKELLGYRPVVEQGEAVRKSMEWGMANC